MTPSVESDRPGGSDPPVTDQRYPGTPPDAATVAEQAAPRRPDGSAEVETASGAGGETAMSVTFSVVPAVRIEIAGAAPLAAPKLYPRM